MTKLLKNLARDRNGATAIEYGLIAAFIALALVTSLGGVKDAVKGKFDQVGADVAAAGTE